MITTVLSRRDIGVLEILLAENLAERLYRASRVGHYSMDHALHAILHHGLTIFERERLGAANTDETTRG